MIQYTTFCGTKKAHTGFFTGNTSHSGKKITQQKGESHLKNTNRQPSSGSVLLGMAAGAALGAVGTMAMAQNQRQVKRTARKLAKGAERAMSQLDTMVTDLVERRMDL